MPKRNFIHLLTLMVITFVTNSACKTVHETRIGARNDDFVYEEVNHLYWLNRTVNGGQGVTHPEALKLCKAQSFGGKSWRLPTVDEVFRTFVLKCDSIETFRMVDHLAKSGYNGRVFRTRGEAEPFECRSQGSSNMNKNLPFLNSKEGRLSIWTNTYAGTFYNLNDPSTGALKPLKWATDNDNEHFGLVTHFGEFYESANYQTFYAEAQTEKSFASVLCVSN